jgi:hypothetical protein
MTHITRTGRELDVEALNQAINKVTLGFKCNPQVKLRLALEAEEEGVSLSSYIEGIILKREAELYSQEEVDQMLGEMDDELNFYEHIKIQKAFKLYEGKTLEYVDDHGKTQSILIRSFRNMFMFFIHQIKL